MADYYGVWRTNTFRVKDFDAFYAWTRLWPDACVEKREDGVIMIPSYDAVGDLPSERYHPLNDGEDDFPRPADFLAELAPHIDEGSVCVIMLVGHEKLRYVKGRAWAIKGGSSQGLAHGHLLTFDLNDIIKAAKRRFALPITECAY